MVRFEEVLAAHPNQPLHISELCELIGVTERTLRSCCAADPATASVAEIASGRGFTELGRFAGAYRIAFGESPSTTLRRSRGPGILDPTFADSA